MSIPTHARSETEAWQAEQRRLVEEADRKRSEATKKRERTETGTLKKGTSVATSSGSTGKPKADKKAKTSTAKAAAAGTNRGTVERMDRIEKADPGLYQKVVAGEMTEAAATREVKRAEARLGEMLKGSSKGTFKKGGETSLPPDITKKESRHAQVLSKNPDVIAEVVAEARLGEILKNIPDYHSSGRGTMKRKVLPKNVTKKESHHGAQLKTAEKKKYAQEMTGLMSVAEIAETLSVNERTIREWTQSQRQAIEDEETRRILELYLMAENTQQDIADEMEIPQNTISNKIKKFIENGNISESDKIPSPYLYNIWNEKSKDEDKDYFGAFPAVYMRNLLYYHSNLFDIIYDPFAGTGTTIDVCKEMSRRYYCSDLNPYKIRDDIHRHDIKDGRVPKLSGIPDLVFLDPP